MKKVLIMTGAILAGMSVYGLAADVSSSAQSKVIMSTTTLLGHIKTDDVKAMQKKSEEHYQSWIKVKTRHNADLVDIQNQIKDLQTKLSATKAKYQQEEIDLKAKHKAEDAAFCAAHAESCQTLEKAKTAAMARMRARAEAEAKAKLAASTNTVTGVAVSTATAN